MWFMNFLGDILVIMYMGFDLVDLFDEWVYGFYNGGYLRLLWWGFGGFGFLMWNRW